MSTQTTGAAASGANDAGAAPSAGRFVGSRVLRKEDARFLAGRGQFVDDVVLPAMVHAAFVRSPLARARIVRLDVRRARELTDVVAVWTGPELNGDVVGGMNSGLEDAYIGPPMGALAEDEVRFVGDVVAIVIARSRYVAEDACELVEVDYEPLPPVLDYLTAAENPVLVHESTGTNVIASMGSPPDPELEAALASSHRVFEETFFQHRQTNMPMETRGLVARWDPAGRQLQLWMSSQNPYEARMYCANVLGIPETHVRVYQGDVGGGFGQKFFVGRDGTAVILACRRLGRPVKWIEDRWENLVAANHAREARMTVKLGVDADCRITAAQVDFLDDSGAYPLGYTEGEASLATMMFPGPYRVPRYGFTAATVYTNKCAKAPYRGPWLMESVARECLMDIAARGLGLDPLEFRRRNVIALADCPFLTVTGVVYEDISPSETIEQAVAMLDYEGFRREQRAAREQGRHLGVGISSYVEPTSMGLGAIGTEVAHVRVEPTGAVTAAFGTASHGQGLETTLAQVVADNLGVDVDDVTVLQGDTAVSSFGGGTGGSRSAVMGGAAGRLAALELRAKVLDLAAHVLEAAVDDLELEGGTVHVRGTPTRSVALRELAGRAYLGAGQLPAELSAGLEASARFVPPMFTFSNATHVCTCEVDIRTGQVTLLRYIVSEDCGVMINPMIVEGQIAGGVVQGLGGVLYEHMVYDEVGNPSTTTLLDYLVPTAADVPLIEYGHVVTPSKNPGGHKGMGEGGNIGSPAAVINAIGDALSPFGIAVTRQPLSADRILDLLEAARDREQTAARGAW